MKFRYFIVLATAFTAMIAVGGLGMARLNSQPPTLPATPLQSAETAIFAGGCFWGVQAAFDDLPGVVSTRVGYTGGTTRNPTYSKVVSGTTGHAEAVEVTFNPNKTSFTHLVQIHLEHVRPSKRETNADQARKHYRHSIFVRDTDQQIAAETALAQFNQKAAPGKYRHVLIEDKTVFWEAEAEHQNYLAKCIY